jgi:hypothetical protein
LKENLGNRLRECGQIVEHPFVRDDLIAHEGPGVIA